MKINDCSIIPIPKIKVHRVQGATLMKTHLYLDNTIFCDCQAYVLLSRVRNVESLHNIKFDKCSF